MSMDQMRTGDVFNVSKVTEPVVIIGCGALGSAVALLLAKLGIPLILMDSDVVEPHNLPNQLLYGVDDVGQKKSDVLSKKLSAMTGIPSRSFAQRYEDGVPIVHKHVFSCVDSMAVRKSIFTGLVDRDGTFVDGRIGARDFSVYVVERVWIHQLDEYRESLFDDSEANIERAACGTVMSIGATAALAASYMVWSFMDCVMGREVTNVVHGTIAPMGLTTHSWYSEEHAKSDRRMRRTLISRRSSRSVDDEEEEEDSE